MLNPLIPQLYIDPIDVFYIKSRRSQDPTDLDFANFEEFPLIPLSDLLIYVLHFALVTRGLHIIGGRFGHSPISEPPRTLKNRNRLFKPTSEYYHMICYQCAQK